MDRLAASEGLVVALEGRLKPGLRRIAQARSMSVMEAEAAERVFQAVVRRRPRVVLVQVGELLEESLKLIRLVAGGGGAVRLIAAATSHSTKIEQAVRRAGATYYLPGTRLSLVDRLLDAVLIPGERG